MCGIAGIVSQRPIENIESRLSRSLSLLAHRGPDDSGTWIDSNLRVGFVHSRLSVIDLTAGGHQPMRSNSERYIIVFNGEIYNYRALRELLQSKGHKFRSSSDTEVVLASYAEWGRKFVEQLDGMFSIAILDRQQNEMILARDRAGEKPLFYSYSGGQLRFASELPAILELVSEERVIDPSALDYYLAYGYGMPDKTLVQGVLKLPPAHFLVLSLTSLHLTIERYWAPPALEANLENPEALAEELDFELKLAVNRQMVADVPLAVFLSGGLDSSLISAYASQFASGLKTYSVSMGDSPLDESHHARKVANFFGTDHHEIPISEVNASFILDLAVKAGEPLADSSIIATALISREVAKTCKVALGGDGADELFGGYGHHQKISRRAATNKVDPTWLRWAMDNLAEPIIPAGFPGRDTLLNRGTGPWATMDWATHFSYSPRKALMANRGNWQLQAEDLRRGLIPKSDNLVQDAMQFDFENYLPEDILLKVDRASMLSSLEVRAPFLDRRILDFSFRKVSSKLKVDTQDRKILLKMVARKILPPDFVFDRKQGFSIPLGEWLIEPSLREIIADTLLDSGSFFSCQAVKKLLRHQNIGAYNSERIFALFQFEVWRKENRITDIGV